MLKIAVVAVPPVKPFDLSMPSTMFESAVVGGEPGYAVTVCTAEPGVIASGAGFDLVVRNGLEAVAEADTVIVPSTGSRYGTDEHVLEALRDAAASGKRVASICSGAFVLAQAGLLDGRTATTHWGLAEEFRRAHPGVDLDPDVLFVDEGPVLTGAGSAAGIDLCLHLIRTDYGAAVANSAARAAVVTPVRQGGQAQFVETPLPPETGSPLGETRAWALRHLDRAISLEELARHAKVSPRTLTRRFTAETGVTPFQWLLQQRLHRARELLESTGFTVDQVARRSGFGTAESLRQHMARHVGLTPSAYRSAFTRTPAGR
ncbi:GlxA family transcriptional regulator [Glycomyces tenuis]|uniref:GlxA family transcriptional regulator n=2 Tax=Glycomyces tenuis TaxID=58116 RepID=UPI0004252005|nr:helix-turn-helix domain-containing protein [Glycomyces tenuis]